MGAPRVLVYSHEDEPLFELDPQQLYGLSLEESINGEHALSITTSQEMEKGQRVFILDEGRWKEFVVAGAEAEHGESLRAFTTYYCPWSLQHDLTVSYIKSRRVGDADDLRGATDAIAMVASATDRWGVGTVDNSSVSSGWFYYTSAWDALSRVVSQWQGEVDATITMSDPIGRAIDFYDEQGSGTARRRFDYGADMTSVKRTVMDGAFVCRIVPRGKGEQVEGDTEAYGRRITIESVNGGKDYIEDEDAVPLVRLPDGHGGYEYPTQIVIYEDIETPAELLAAAQRDLEKYTRPKVGYEADVLALSAAGMDAAGVSLGDAVQVVDRTFGEGGLRIEARVVGIERDLLDPANDGITIGNFMPSTADAIKQLERSTAAMSESIVDLDGKSGEAMDIAEAAQTVANATGQHFWHADDGAHVTEVTKDEWNDAAGAKYHTGANSLWNSLGMLFRKGLTNLMALVVDDPDDEVLGTTGVAIYDGKGNASGNILASFTDAGVNVGNMSAAHTLIEDSQTSWYYNGRTLAGRIGQRDRSSIKFNTIDGSPAVSKPLPLGRVQGFVLDGALDFSEPISFYVEVYSVSTRHQFTFTDYGEQTYLWSNSDGAVTGKLVVGLVNEGNGVLTLLNAECSISRNIDATIDRISYHAFIEAPTFQFGYLASPSSSVNGYSMSVGNNARATGIESFAQGHWTQARGDMSVAHGDNTIAAGEAQTVLGTYNVADYGSALIIGNGTSVNDRSNALTVDWSGNVSAQGRITGNGLTSRDEIYRTTDIDPSTAPSANKYRTIFRANDAGGTNMGYMQAFQNTSNVDGILLNAIRMVNGSAVYNGVTFGIGATGTRSVTVSDASAWLTALGFSPVFYRDGTGYSDVFTPASGFTADTGNIRYFQRGKFATVLVAVRNTSALTANTTYTIGTMASGRRPYAQCALSDTTHSTVAMSGNVNAAGTVTVKPRANVAANGYIVVGGSFILA